MAAFRAEIEGYLARCGMGAKSFGVAAMGDPNFVYDLRAGRTVLFSTAEKVRRFIAGNPPRAEPAPTETAA